MAERVRKEHQHRRVESDDQSSERRSDENRIASSTSTDIEQILDEIDDVLESNAEDFVRNYVQKGGQ